MVFEIYLKKNVFMGRYSFVFLPILEFLWDVGIWVSIVFDGGPCFCWQMFSPPVGPNAGLKNNAQQQQQPNQSMEFGFKPGTVFLNCYEYYKGPI